MLFDLFVLLTADLYFGYVITHIFTYHRIDVLSQTGIGFVVGIIVSSFSFLFSRTALPLTKLHLYLHCAVFVSAGIDLNIFKKKKNQVKTKILTIQNLFAILIPFVFLCYMFYFGMFYKELYTKGACYGDLPFHLNIISSFAHGCNSVPRKGVFNLISPFFSNLSLSYPIIPDYYSAVIYKCCGVGYHEAIVYPSIVCAYSLLVILTKIVCYFSQDNNASLISSFLFLFIGGLGFTRFFDKNIRNEFNVDYVHNWGNNRYEAWFQTVVHILLPQRASLFSLPIAYSIIYLLMNCANSRIVDFKSFAFIGFLVALLPQVQAHSIIAVAQWCIFYIILTFPYRKIGKQLLTYIKNYSILAIVAIVLGFPQMIPFLFRVSEKNFMKISPLWKGETNKNFFSYWILALGILFILSFTFVFFTLNHQQICYYIPSIFVFIIGNFIWYQPWHLDNTKVFNAAWIPLVIAAISHFLVTTWKKVKFVGPFISIILFILCIASGVLSNINAAKLSFPLWSIKKEVFNFANFVKLTDPQAIWLTDSSHTNPIVTLGGRQTVLGYMGWLSSHGINYYERYEDIYEHIIKNPDNVKYADKYNITFVGVDKINQKEFYFNPNSSSKNWRKIYESFSYDVYKRIK